MERFFKESSTTDRAVAYFSMEVGLMNEMPTYSGGLGVLAGDTIKSAADLHVPMIAVTLLHEHGYFTQHLNPNGEQSESPTNWDIKKYLQPLDAIVQIKIEKRKVSVSPWLSTVKGVRGYEVPVIFLDTNVQGNSDYDRTLTSQLYGGDETYRLCQEMVLGIGGIRMLNALGYKDFRKYHMNEGHAAFLTIELLHQMARAKEPIEAVRERCVFTTHTPVAAGHDRFPVELVKQTHPEFPFENPDIEKHVVENGMLNMTKLGLRFSTYINGVAKKHGEVSREMFPGYVIEFITNGVHSGTWVSPQFKKLFDTYIPGWMSDPFSLRYAMAIPHEEIWQAHCDAKASLIEETNKRTNAGLRADVLTIGFARRATAYKRTDLLLHDIQRLNDIASRCGPLQVVYAGKSHPRDGQGKEFIKRIFSSRNSLNDSVKLVYVENYDMDFAKLIVSGSDVWLNTPIRPKEASGTSGMKAAHNGVPSLSVLDGWWIEGCIENLTGWSIGPKERIPDDQDREDARDLYNKLEYVILPTFYNNSSQWIDIMKHTIAINGSFFNTHRMVSQYVLNAYFP